MVSVTEVLSLAIAAILVIAAIVVFLKNRRRFQSKLEKQAEALRRVFDMDTDAILIISGHQHLLYANEVAQTLFSMPIESHDRSLDPMPEINIKGKWESLDHFMEQQKGHIKEGGQRYLEISIRCDRYGKSSLLVNLHLDTIVFSEDCDEPCILLRFHDLEEQEKYKKVLNRHKLTGLPNHGQAKEDMNQLFAKMHLNNKKIALLLLDIDNFSQIRSMLGYEQSESMLIGVAEYLKRLVKESPCNAYHTYSNKFLISLPAIESELAAISFAQRIQNELRSFYRVNKVRFHLSLSIGIAIYPESGSTRNLIDHTYKALVQAHRKGVGQICVYESKSLKQDYDELALFNDVHDAIAKEELEVYYQPIVRADTDEVVAAEALIKWHHKEYGFVPSDVFIPMLEKSGYIEELGKYVLLEVLKQQKRWEVFKFKPIEVSINMSLIEIESDRFVDHIERQLQEFQVKPHLIKFEVTEGVAMQNEEHVFYQLHRLRKLGVSISLDDFGTGYTSFSYLKKLPANVVKIDKSMVEHLLDKTEDQRIVKAMIELGHNIGMKIVTEGIESKAMAQMLASFGCDYLQGYYFGKPQPAYEFQELIRR